MSAGPRTASAGLFDEAPPAPAADQFRLRRLQVFNWGTFSGLHDVPVAERGFLFVGRSGSGKSTLLDAMAALLTPPQLVDFNAAAREAERSGRDRSLVSYVRGAWADRHDDDSGEVATQYLRRGSTWSAIALEFHNGEGRTVSLVRVLWMSGNGSAAQDVRKHYMVAERTFDIGSELEGFDLDLRRLKQRIDDVHHHDSFSAYAERFRRLLGIENESALKLLHKTQSAKNLGDLNAFLREFMLDRPETFAVAERLVDEFSELDAAHRAVVTAREQIEVLEPAEQAHRQWCELQAAIREADEVLVGVDPCRNRAHRGLLQQALARAEQDAVAASGEEAVATERLEHVRADVDRLRDAVRDHGGDRLQSLEQALRRAETERTERERSRRRMAEACRALDRSEPSSPGGFAEAQDQARSVLEHAAQQRRDLDERLDAMRGEQRDDERTFAELRKEIETLERNPSNVPAEQQALRARLADALGLDEGSFPFVAELLQVRPEFAEWCGAIERLLHGFGLSVLVDERHYARVAAWVDQTHLRGKLVYYRVQRERLPPLPPAQPETVPARLEIRDHAFAAWLGHEIQRRFDYRCCDSLQVFRSTERALTLQGQVRHGRGRHEKDDRRAIDDRRRWILGFDNRDKLKLFREEAASVGMRLAGYEANIAALGAEREQLALRQQAAQRLLDLDWSGVDVAAMVSHIGDLDAQIRQVRDGNQTLADLNAQLDAARKRLSACENAVVECKARLRQVNDCIGQYRQGLARYSEEAMAIEPTPLQASRIQERLGHLGELTLDNVEALFRRVEREIKDERNSRQLECSELANRVSNRIGEFMRRWPEDSGNFQADIAYADDVLVRLARLREDGLPAHEARFFDLLQSQSQQSLLALQAYMTQAYKEIRARMEDVNASLEQVAFNRGSILRIRVEDLRHPEVVEFRQALAQVLGHQQTMDRELAEARFSKLRALVKRLGAADPEHRRWRDKVLDVRGHVEFIGEELDAADRRQLEVYRSGAGKSGGQRQKLATTCLAAALRYQLGDIDGGPPRYAPVVLDEAFDKADNEFTAMAMTIFENFGFQMIVATPLKSVMTLEPFIGGACFVDIEGRHDSRVLIIEYDEAEKRLNLPQARQRDAHA